MASPIVFYGEFSQIIKEFLVNGVDSLCNQIFEDKLSCLIIYRGLNSFNQKILLKFIVRPSISSEYNKSDLKSEFEILKCDSWEDCIQELVTLKILRSKNHVESGDTFYTVERKFLDHIDELLHSKIDDLEGYLKSISTIDSNCPALEGSIIERSNNRWDELLSFISNAGKINWKEYTSYELLSVFLLSGVVKYNSLSSEVCITSYGFQFLLRMKRDQILTTIYYLIMWTNLKFDITPVKCIMILSMFAHLNRELRFKSDCPEFKDMSQFLNILKEMGLLFVPDDDPDSFYLSRELVAALNLPKKYESMDKDSQMMILEKNFRLYCYNLSPLQKSIVALFAEILCLFPSMIVCRISRESCHQAFSFGISPNQILSFISHYCQRFGKVHNISTASLIPDCVYEQLMLWEKQCQRIQTTPSVLYNGFTSVNEFNEIYEFCQERQILVAFNRDKRFIIVSPTGHSAVKRFWKNKKNR